MDFWKGTSTELLKSLHILTRDGKMNADSRRKLKQVTHLAQLIEPTIKNLAKKFQNFSLVDMGAGKSYLGFILYDLILRELGNGQIISIETRPELIQKSEELARVSKFERMKFIASSIQEAQVTDPVHLVCALHACDTATDDAILFGLRQQVQAFALVPCCQAEVARQLKENVSETAFQSLFDFPLHRREFGSHLTNVIRTLFLQAQGYQVTVTELVGWEHALKNEFILAEKVSDQTHPKSQIAQRQLNQLLGEFRVKPTLVHGNGLKCS